ncbi:glycosyltransferase [Plectonema cf. radiosum LEGE 06105]|uniref:Glycosyltransferase n=1 Tax=Plectonema cf. radiosum LEGE 06105 TaxID=945769 RepID=A0A8J7F1R8_9CYAN|nr:glycosyltransferase [Plectonema radiosum]MBE9214536.1 glycosyltransferase [Plectonema cf. radiosum LEGE 06105]
MNKPRIAFFLPNLYGGGAERIAINLLQGMSSPDIDLDLVLADAEGPLLKQVPSYVRIVNFASVRVLKAIPALSHYLKENQPFALVSHLAHANVAAVLARELAGTKTKLMLVEHNTLTFAESKLWRARFVPLFMKWLYPRANFVVGVSQGVTEDIKTQLGLEQEKVNTIYNPVVDDKLFLKAKITLNHPWFQQDAPPVFLAVGRLTEQKDFSTLIKAFALVRKQRLARLIILGEGEARGELEAIVKSLGITEDVSLPGFVGNPYAYMYNASAFVLSSSWEGLPTVLIEAMACGCPVVSTDCPTGPKEILESGKYGELVSVGDAVALSKAMLNVLDNPMNSEILAQRTQDFSVDKAVDKYLELLSN